MKNILFVVYMVYKTVGTGVAFYVHYKNVYLQYYNSKILLTLWGKIDFR